MVKHPNLSRKLTKLRISPSSHSSNASTKQSSGRCPKVWTAVAKRCCRSSSSEMRDTPSRGNLNSKSFRSTWRSGRAFKSWYVRDRYIPIVDFSSSSPLALKKNDITIASPFNFLALATINFISVDLPDPGLPLIQKTPWWSIVLSRSSQSLYSGLWSNHLHVLVWATLTVENRVSIASNHNDSIQDCCLSRLGTELSPDIINHVVRVYDGSLRTSPS